MPIGKVLRNEEFARRFAIEYLKDLKGPAAVMRAGGSKVLHNATIHAHRLLKRTDVQAFIQEALAKQRQAKVIDANRVLEEIEKLALVDTSLAIDQETGDVKPVGAWPDGLGQCLSSFDVEELYDKMTGEKRGRIVKARFWDKTKSLEMLAKYLRLWVEGSGANKAPTEPVDLKWADEKTLRKLAEGK